MIVAVMVHANYKINFEALDKSRIFAVASNYLGLLTKQHLILLRNDPEYQ